MSEWDLKTIGDLSENITKGTTPPKGKGFIDSPGINYIKSDAIKYDGRIDSSKFVFIDFETHEKFKRSQLKQDDILFSMAGAYLGKNGLVTKEMLPANTNQALAIIRLKKNICLPVYLSYYLRQNNIIDYVNNMSGQSAQPNINFQEIASIEIPLPPLPEQKVIASVLSSLDDKIDLLHRQNKTLEAMAETLFRQWFVEEAEDFDNGFLGDIIELAYGKALKKELRTGDKYPVVGSSGIVDYHDDFLVNGPGIVIGRKGTLGKVTYLHDNFYPIDTTYFIKSKVNSVGLLYEYFLLKSINFEEMNSDSAVPGLNRNLALSTEIKIAPEEKLHNFNKLNNNLFSKMKCNNAQIIKLENIRDLLLTKLMSGEVKLKN